MRLVPGVLVVAACGSPSHAKASTQATSASATSPSPAATSASPAPTPPSTTEITAWVNAAELSTTGVGASKPVNDVPGPAAVFGVCNTGISADSDVRYAHYWRWVGRKVPYVEHGVYGYDVPAADVVGQIQTRADSCKSYDVKDPSSTGRLEFVGAYAFKPLAGIDGSYAFCEKSTTVAPASAKGQVAYICTAAVSRGNVLATIRVFGTKPTLSTAHVALARALPLAENALIKAVPAP